MSTLIRVSREHLDNLAPLFASLPRGGLRGLMLAVLEGHLGEAFADDPLAPRVAELCYAGVHLFGSPEYFCERGVGYCALHEGRIVSAASSGAFHDAGIEVQINTLPEHRGRGLAAAVAAHLLLHCLEWGREPTWCTGNPISAHLAEKLGYTKGEPFELLVLTSRASDAGAVRDGGSRSAEKE